MFFFTSTNENYQKTPIKHYLDTSSGKKQFEKQKLIQCKMGTHTNLN
jgi:hypothetical protein